MHQEVFIFGIPPFQLFSVGFLSDLLIPAYVIVNLPAKHAKRHEKREIRIPNELKRLFPEGTGGLAPLDLLV